MDAHAIDAQIEKAVDAIRKFAYDGEDEKWQSEKEAVKAIITDYTLNVLACEHEWMPEHMDTASSNANAKKWRCKKCLLVNHTYD